MGLLHYQAWTSKISAWCSVSSLYIPSQLHTQVNEQLISYQSQTCFFWRLDELNPFISHQCWNYLVYCTWIVNLQPNLVPNRFDLVDKLWKSMPNKSEQFDLYYKCAQANHWSRTWKSEAPRTYEFLRCKLFFSILTIESRIEKIILSITKTNFGN